MPKGLAGYIFSFSKKKRYLSIAFQATRLNFILQASEKGDYQAVFGIFKQLYEQNLSVPRWNQWVSTYAQILLEGYCFREEHTNAEAALSLLASRNEFQERGADPRFHEALLVGRQGNHQNVIGLRL